MQAPEYFRYRIHFQKSGPLVWSGHLDLQTCWERIFRRAGIPVAYSNGFHRRPKFVFSATLPLGMSGSDESLDLWCDDPIHPDRTIAAINGTAPDGLKVMRIVPIDSKAKKPTHGIVAAEYTAIVPLDLIHSENTTASNDVATVSRSSDEQAAIAERLAQFNTVLHTKIDALLRKTEVEKVKGSKAKKRYNLRPLITALSVSTGALPASTSAPYLIIAMRLSLKEGATGRPDAVLEELDLDPHHVTVTRTRIIREGTDG